MFLFHLIIVVKMMNILVTVSFLIFNVLRLMGDKLFFFFLWRNCTEKAPKFPVSYQQYSNKAGKMSNENLTLFLRVT